MSDSGQVLQGAKMQTAKINSSAMLTLCVSSDDTSRQEQVRYFLSPAEETVLGRAPECQIVLDPNRYTTVSRHHAKVRMLANNDKPAWEICNLSATNGTYINGKQIEGCQILQPGDCITLSWNGPEFLFEYQSLQATVVIQPPPTALKSVEPAPVEKPQPGKQQPALQQHLHRLSSSLHRR